MATSLPLKTPVETATGLTHEECILDILGVRVRRLRTRLGLSRRALSDMADISERHLAQLETGRGNISVVLLARLAGALNTSLADLFRPDPGNVSTEDLVIADILGKITPADKQHALQLLQERFCSGPQQKSRLALIGLRGAGKTTIGKLIADKTGLPFVQLVSEIQRVAGMDVSEIFSLWGQEYYRKLEERVLIETIMRYDSCVIEAGGSIVMEQKLLHLLLNTCFVAWLSADASDHMQRVIDQGDLRPLENNEDAMSDLRRILEQRRSFYQQSHTTVVTSGRSVDECVEELMEQFALNNKV